MNVVYKFKMLIPDKIYIMIQYFKHFHRFPNLKNPKTFNEKLQWLKLHDRRPEYSIMVDKYEVKKYVAEQIGEEYIIPTLGVWNCPKEIDFEKLPKQFVLKWNHDSGSIFICKDKNNLDQNEVLMKLKRGKEYSGFWYGREWPYKNVKPQIIAEQYIEDNILHDLPEYKFFTFNGIPKIVHVESNRHNQNVETYGDFFDMEYNHLDLTIGHINAPVLPKKSENFELMKRFAETLAVGTKMLRVDFYEVEGKVYFGELTFYQNSGYADVQPPEWNKILGDWINLEC